MATVCDIVIHPEFRTELDQQDPLAAMLDVDVVAFVAALLRQRGPPDVANFVPAIVVDAINGVLLAWGRADLSQERREVIAPFRGDRDASQPVVRIALGFRVEASRDNSSPR